MLHFSRRALCPRIVVTPDFSITPTGMMLKAKVGAWTLLANVIGMPPYTVTTLSAPPQVVGDVSAASAVEEREGQAEFAGRQCFLRDAGGPDLERARRL